MSSNSRLLDRIENPCPEVIDLRKISLGFRAALIATLVRDQPADEVDLFSGNSASPVCPFRHSVASVAESKMERKGVGLFSLRAHLPPYRWRFGIRVRGSQQ